MRASSIAATAIAGALSAPAFGFDYFEHRYLGNAAYRNAEKLAAPADLQRITREKLGFGDEKPPLSDRVAGRLMADLPVQFGDLSGLAGDFAGDSADLRRRVDEMRRGGWFAGSSDLALDTRRQWVSACKWFHRSRSESRKSETPPAPFRPGLKARERRELMAFEGDLNDCFARSEPDAVPEETNSEFGSAGYQASREELAGHEMIANYISLASQNRSHFPRHSWTAYERYHRKALRFASCFARRDSCVGERAELVSGDELLVEALLNEAFAQHFLQDSFSAGHVGSAYGDCALGVFCKPTKRTLKQTHDVLNELGVDVVIKTPPDHLRDIAGKVSGGWTAFGDDHLFIREADFHRYVVVRTATASMSEVLERAARDGEGCRMCDPGIFPVPGEPAFISEKSHDALAKRELIAEDSEDGDLAASEPACEFLGTLCLDRRSLDPRIPAVPVEGWKLGIAHVRQSLGGNLITGPLEQGAMMRIDYMRSGDPLMPNTYGFELWGLPNFRTSYLLTAGYFWPRVQSPLSVAVRAKFGWRTEDAFTRNNPDPQRVGSVELTFPSFELTYDLYPPVALFATMNAATFLWKNGQYSNELANHHFFTLAFGLRFDLSGI